MNQSYRQRPLGSETSEYGASNHLDALIDSQGLGGLVELVLVVSVDLGGGQRSLHATQTMVSAFRAAQVSNELKREQTCLSRICASITSILSWSHSCCLLRAGRSRRIEKHRHERRREQENAPLLLVEDRGVLLPGRVANSNIDGAADEDPVDGEQELLVQEQKLQPQTASQHGALRFRQPASTDLLRERSSSAQSSQRVEAVLLNDGLERALRVSNKK